MTSFLQEQNHWKCIQKQRALFLNILNRSKAHTGIFAIQWLVEVNEVRRKLRAKLVRLHHCRGCQQDPIPRHGVNIPGGGYTQMFECMGYTLKVHKGSEKIPKSASLHGRHHGARIERYEIWARYELGGQQSRMWEREKNPDSFTHGNLLAASLYGQVSCCCRPRTE